MARAIQIFLDSDLRCSHDGLAMIAKKEKIDVSKLEPGEYVIFVNSAKDKCKVYAAFNVVAYLKPPKGHKIEMKVIQLIPVAFAATGRIDYDKALKELLEKELTWKGRNNDKS